MSLVEAKKVESGSRDAISSFPDEILAKILSFLPTKRAFSTSILSKRWRNLFPLMIHLYGSQHHFDFDDSDLLFPEEECKKERKHVHQSFRDFVDKIISVCNAMEKLSLKCLDGLISCELTDQWIRNALDRGVVDLDLRLRIPVANRLPPSVFMNKTLVKLTLGLDVGAIPMSFQEVFLPVLKSLFLHSFWYRNEVLCVTLLPGSPILEELFLHHLPGVIDPRHRHTTPPGKMTHGTLKRLTFHYNNSFDLSRFMTLNLPSLVYLDYSGLAPFRYSRANFDDSLVEAKLDVDVQQTYSVYNHLLTIISSVRNVKTLSLSSTSVKAMYSNCEELYLSF